jgi:hypothetical protein
MKTALLLVLMVCALAYVRFQQPATWNSWMTALLTTHSATASAPADSSAPASSSDSAAPAPATEPPKAAPAGGVVKEGDFASGGLYWQGDGESGPGGKGVEVKLNPSAWTRVYQSFTGDQRALYSIEVTYRFSPGLTVSQNPSDYTDISHRLQISGFEKYGSIGIPPGDFYGTIGDTSSKSITCEVYTPRYGSTAVQDYQHTYAAVPPNGNNIFALAFPPGTGTVTLLTVYVIGR